MKIYEAYIFDEAEDASVLAMTPELAREAILEFAVDYFGKPVEWREPVVGTRHVQVGYFYREPYHRTQITIAEREVLEA